ncbi:MAG: arsenosugar biosynthesis radical SAM (seleno)protein ArsS [Bacteroidota bacterium]
MKSLKALGHRLSQTERQIAVLENDSGVDPFTDRLRALGLSPLRPTEISIFQVNVGKMCNQVCKHCHVDAGPDRREIMTRETMQECLDALAKSNIQTVDLTGGAPEMNPDFRWFVKGIKALGRHVIVRCNLTIIVANRKYHDLPEFFKKHNIEVVSSLPSFKARSTDRQRGNGVFERSIRALKMLNDVGYGKEGSGLTLNLVYNPSGAMLPGDQDSLEAEYKRALKRDFDIEFNHLFAITNLPISRFLDYLVASENYQRYMEELANAFNPMAAENVMCRSTLSVSWDGYMYDCDFNQMLELKVKGAAPHVRDFDLEALTNREIILNQHCYGCTAGAGSSCGGEVT